MAYHRATNGSYEKWANEVGDNSYSLRNLEQYFNRSVNLTSPNGQVRRHNASVGYQSASTESLDGHHRPLQLSWPYWTDAISTWSEKAFQAMGFSKNPEGFESGELDGYFYNPATVDPTNQHRSSSQTSFLDYAMKTTSLKVYTRTLARQILFTGNKTACGVIVQAGSQNFTLTANREVVLSAGTFQSPQLLMVSGVGPRETLRQHSIPQIAHLPGVGQNMQDQPFFGVQNRVSVPTSSKLLNDAEYAAEAAMAYLANGTGPLAGPPGLLAFERLSDTKPQLLSNATLAALQAYPNDWPQIEYLTQNGASGYNRNYRTADPEDGHNYATISVVVVSPFSRGNISISSPDASVQPTINPNWLTAPEDVDIAVAGFKRIRELWSNMNVTIREEYLPGPNVTTDGQIVDFMRQSAFTLYHAASTCKMGKSDDGMAVVDPQARVYGVHGLRVVDASAFPFLPPGHPQATVYMLAEKIAEDIRRKS